MTCMHDTYVALSPSCLIRIATRCGSGPSGARCPLPKRFHRQWQWDFFLLCYSALMSSLPSDFSNISLSPASLPEFLVQPCGCMAPGGPGCGGGRCAAVTFWAGCGWSPVAVLITHQGFLCLFCRAPCYVSSLSNVHVVIM